MTETQIALALSALAVATVLAICVRILHRASLAEMRRNRRDYR